MSSPQPFSQVSLGSRPCVPQNSMLALLPTEIIIPIAELIDSQRDSRRTLDHLSQACVRMYHIVRPYFYRAENFLQFHNAVSVANITMMERCEYFDAAPVDVVWDRPNLDRPNQCRYTPVELFLRNVDEGKDRQETADRAALRDSKRDKVFDALGWLLERGANGEVSMANECFEDIDLPSGHMSSQMLRQFQVGTSQRGSEVLFNMIRMLSRYGYSNPTRPDSIGGWQCIDKPAWYEGTMTNYYTASPLDLALKSHVPPSLLNLMLEEYEARGLRLRDLHSECPPSLVQSASRQTNMEGEVADIFKAKLDIMIKHEMIDNSERALLSSIGAALYRIASIGHAAGGLGKKHFKMSWEMLWNAVRPFTQDPNLVLTPWEALVNHGPRRIHRFAIHSGRDPWRWWLIRHDARLFSRDMVARRVTWSSIMESRGGYDLFSFIQKNMNWDRLPAWHTAGLDEWIALVKNAPGRHSLMPGEDDGLASFLYPESVTASIFEYRTIQGRTYHSDRHATEYFTPNDEQQLQSVDISHHYLTILLDNNLFLAPISPHVQKVLDVDFADTYPSAQVIGSDLSPCQPEWVPPNVHFEIADASLPWPWKDNYFDFVHIRYLFGAIHDWPALFHEAYRCCASGGWVQSCEADVHFYSDDGTAETEPGFKMWGELYEVGGVTTGKPFFLQQEAIQERSITEAGFTDIKILDYKLPVGGWPNNRKLAEVGEYVKLTLENDLEGYTSYLWHNMLNWPPEEYPHFLTAMHKSLNNRKAHGYMMVRYVYGRKP
ncbi:hypothetical protein KAF25_002669 [Fusarium avenaceum]|uniref:Uncharacterized protein n=1 Tax=Fusarium avenaceum TaxID=40199 RepID=A0A9P7H1X6_9HYPO|nr:hypothetical protein KAF25_002669 [Fusarium avenaceum]